HLRAETHGMQEVVGSTPIGFASPFARPDRYLALAQLNHGLGRRRPPALISQGSVRVVPNACGSCHPSLHFGEATTHMGAPLSTVALAIALSGCLPKPVPDDQAAAMQAGLDAFYTRHDPQAAAIEFQKVLAANPTHYGATFQLAAALDAAGRSDEARPLWEKMRALAESSGDQQTAAPARAKLGPPPVPTEETLMRAGLDALYQRHDPAAAAAEFQQVLANNPTLYGATFQLAVALDAAGQPKEARPYWEKALAMAQRYADTETADRARARLAAPDVPSNGAASWKGAPECGGVRGGSC